MSTESRHKTAVGAAPPEAKPRGPKLATWMRRLHRWGAIVVALPALVVFTTGILLQIKKDWAWVQPPMQRGSETTPRVDYTALLAAVRGVPEAQVRDWSDIDRVDLRPATGVIKVTARNRWEVQVDAATGAVLQAAYRRSDMIISLHDGSWFASEARAWVFLPSGAVLLGLLVTGVYLWGLPVVRRRKNVKKREGETEHQRSSAL